MRSMQRDVLSTALGGLFLFSVAGCSTPGEVHPEFARLRPKKVSVLEIKNETFADLDSVEFGGLFQRGLIGVETYDIRSLLRSSLEETLLKAGYKVVPAKEPLGFDPRTPGATLPAGFPSEAVLETVVESWVANDLSNFPTFFLRCRLEMRRVPTAEVLYRGPLVCDERRDPRTQTSGGVAGAIRRSAERALGALPSAQP